MYDLSQVENDSADYPVIAAPGSLVIKEDKFIIDSLYKISFEGSLFSKATYLVKILLEQTRFSIPIDTMSKRSGNIQLHK